MGGSANRRPDQRLFTPAFILLGIADLVYFTAVGVTIYALPLYVTGPVGSDEAGAGLAFGAFAGTALVLRPFAGRLVDQVGRRPLLLVGALLGGVGLAMMPVAHTLAVVIVLRLVQGAGEAVFIVAGFAMLVDLAPPDRTGEALSYNSLGLYLGISFGPPLGAVVLAAGGFLAFASLHSTRIGMVSTSAALMTYGLVVVACRLTMARVPDRLPTLPLGAASLATIGAGLGVVAASGTPAGLLVGTAVMAVGVAFSTPVFFAAVFDTAAPHQRGAAAGTASAALDLGLGLGPLLLGFIARDHGIPVALALAAVLALIGAGWTWSLRPRVPALRTAT